MMDRYFDGIVPDPGAEPRFYASGSDEGFLLIDRSGRILKHLAVGHNQSPVVGKFRPELPGLQYMTVNFWRSPGIVMLFDHDGNILDIRVHTYEVLDLNGTAMTSTGYYVVVATNVDAAVASDIAQGQKTGALPTMTLESTPVRVYPQAGGARDLVCPHCLLQGRH